MVKFDLTRDYYGDLGISSTSDITEIKKQYKKLALIYHPDRNIGNSNLDTTKFQKIQSAYEILIDSTERAKYDANRRSASYRTGTSNKGNPWSHVGRDYPPPPKPPTARNRPAPPPSNGARRYEKFATPQKSAYQASYEGAQARKATYDAWENMRSHHASDKTESNLGNNSGAPKPPPRGPAQSRRVDTDPPQHNAYKASRETYSKSKSQGNYSSTRKNGFMPSTPGGDEQPAPKTAYFTRRDKTDAPPIPPRNPEFIVTDSAQESKSYVEKEPVLESRTSTPYATHGGERLNPFEAPPHLNTSRESQSFSGESSNSAEAHTSHETWSFGKRFSKEKLASYSQKTAENSSESTQTAEETLEDPPPPPAAPIFSRPNYKPTFASSKPADSAFCSARGKAFLDGEPNIFSFKIEDDMFVTTKSFNHEEPSGNRGVKIGDKFMAKDWDGTFAAGSDSNFFEPILNPGQISPRRTQSSTRAQTRSPTKAQNPNLKPTFSEAIHSNSIADVGFSPTDWAETFKTQTFMHPPAPVQPSIISSIRKKSIPSSRPTVNDSTNLEDKSSGGDIDVASISQEDRSSSFSPANIAPPEPMDIDTPQTCTADFDVPKFSGNPQKMNADSQKRRASHSSHPPNETDVQASALKVHFSDLKIKDLVLDLPPPPNPPILPQEEIPSVTSYLDYELKYERYIAEWDHFDKKFLLHFVARKNNNEQLSDRRWKGDEVEAYRATILEDQAVLNKWAEAKEIHAKAIKDWNIYRELKREHDQNERPRKKTA
ncbi:hypothetical protein K3495_g10286 [Podosphaera aphanis]|nr:hypothetical protein K3495_g10286 [Podosphaera aphanis]